MSIARASLGRGPAKVTWGGATLFTREDFIPRFAPVWNPVASSLHGEVDKFKSDLVIQFGITLFGLWENLSVLFPSGLLNPVVGTSLFGTSDNALVIHAKNQDRITYPNAQLTGMPNLYLGVDSELFAAELQFTCLLKNSTNPEDAGAYFVRDTAAYSETTFAKTNFKKARFSGAWGARTGFTTITPQTGFNVSWALDLQPVKVDGLGTVDMHIGSGGMVAACRCIPIGPTAAQIDTNQDVEAPHGTLLGSQADDLTLASSGISVVLKNAGLVSSSTAFGINPLRIGEVGWETTRSITTGTPSAVATVA